MACQCEAVVVHDSLAEATRAAEAALDEVARVESRLSRFDPASEIARINRNASRGPVTLDHELFTLLQGCFTAWHNTHGAFDIAAGSRSDSAGQPITLACSRLLEPPRAIEFTDPGLQLDLGGCGKGYALDRAADVLRSAGVTQACLHAGTSSVLALGAGPDGHGWPIALVDPRDRQRELRRVSLVDRGLATSALVEGDAGTIDPRTGQPVRATRSCTVTARTAFTAEVWSTAGLVMGPGQVAALAGQHREVVHQVYWTEPDRGFAADELL